MQGHSQALQIDAQCGDLLNGCSGSREFGSVCCRFHGHLLLRMPTDWCLVHTVKHACDCSTSCLIVAHVSIDTGGGDDHYPFWCWCIRHLLFSDSAINRSCPVTFFNRQIGVIRQFHSHTQSSMSKFAKVTNHSSHSRQVLFAWRRSKAGHCHNCCGNVKTA